MPNYFHVRINNKKDQPNSDFSVFMREIIEKRESLWDKDNGNKIKKGDYLGIITGPMNNENVYIFLVKEEHSPAMRPSHWAVGTPHTEGNGLGSVDYRGVITLTNNHALPKEIEWRKIRRETGLGGECESWMPRGTQRIVNTQNLPFDFP